MAGASPESCYSAHMSATHRRLLTVLPAVVCLWSCQTEVSSPAPASFDPVLAAQLDAVVSDHFSEASSPGVSVAIALGDGSVHTVTLGLGDADTGRKVAAADVFRIGSITKTFVATVMMQLDEERVLSLDDTLDQRVPGFALGDAVTLRRLMNHTSGVFDFTDDPAFLALSGDDTKPTNVVRWALDHGSVFEPGTGYSYSNTNYFLLGLTIEAATGKKLEEVVQQRLLAPLKLTGVWFEGGSSLPTVSGFIAGSDTGTATANWSWAAGGMDGTASSLCRWAQSLFNAEVLPQTRVAEMTTPTKLIDGREVTYGLGIDLASRGGRELVGHTGSTMGFASEVFFDRETGTCVAVLTNDFLGAPKALSDPLWTVLGK